MNDLFSWVMLILSLVPVLALLSQPAVYRVEDHPPQWWHPLRNIAVNGAAVAVVAVAFGVVFAFMSRVFNL